MFHKLGLLAGLPEPLFLKTAWSGKVQTDDGLGCQLLCPIWRGLHPKLTRLARAKGGVAHPPNWGEVGAHFYNLGRVAYLPRHHSLSPIEQPTHWLLCFPQRWGNCRAISSTFLSQEPEPKRTLAVSVRPIGWVERREMAAGKEATARSALSQDLEERNDGEAENHW